MREIKFRVFDKDANELTYIDSFYWFEEHGVEDSNGKGHYGDYIIMQNTGVKDKNGKDIYEGDIIRWHGLVTFDYTITFTDGVFCLNDSPSENFWHHREDIGEKWEVIGNIYENKNLLK